MELSWFLGPAMEAAILDDAKMAAAADILVETVLALDIPLESTGCVGLMANRKEGDWRE